ncbi:hypothetical protein P7C71_g2244, partial [Lecanoromycetidae sp. Uapishka_2]
MKTTIALLFACLLQYARAAQPTAYTQSRCLTAYSSIAGIPTTTTIADTLTFRPPVLYTLTPSTIVTPAAATTTTTTTLLTTSTLPTPTSTTTFTETDTTTVTTTVSTSTTTTSTSTAAAAVSTIPAPDGFIYPSPTPGAPQKRSMNQPLARGGALINGRTVPKGKSPHCTGSPQKYPSKVTCYELVETFIPTTITRTAKTTTTQFAPTPTSTITASTTSTVTVAASTTNTASTTTTTTLTATETDTATSTITQTATYTPPTTSTVYAACATSANQVSTDYEGRPLNLLDEVATFEESETDSAYDCCVLCFQTANCLGSNYGAQFTGYTCELSVGTTCPASQGANAGDYTDGSNAAFDVTISNGPCGTYNYEQS